MPRPRHATVSCQTATQEQLSKSALSFYLFSSRETRSFFRFQFPVLFAPLSRCVSSYAFPPLYGCPLCGAPPFISAPSAKLISLLKTNPYARRCCALVCSSRFHSFSPLRAFLRSPSDRWFVSCSLEWNRVCHHILTHTRRRARVRTQTTTTTTISLRARRGSSSLFLCVSNVERNRPPVLVRAVRATVSFAVSQRGEENSVCACVSKSKSIAAAWNWPAIAAPTVCTLAVTEWCSPVAFFRTRREQPQSLHHKHRSSVACCARERSRSLLCVCVCVFVPRRRCVGECSVAVVVVNEQCVH